MKPLLTCDLLDSSMGLCLGTSKSSQLFIESEVKKMKPERCATSDFLASPFCTFPLLDHQNCPRFCSWSDRRCRLLFLPRDEEPSRSTMVLAARRRRPCEITATLVSLSTEHILGRLEFIALLSSKKKQQSRYSGLEQFHQH